MLPPVIPIFPLPNVVLFPNVFLPLHIFEPRYREMLADAVDGDRIIGMTLLKPGYEADYEGRPAVYPIGCAGLITYEERLPDGRSNIILRGLEKFRITGEDDSRSYRLACVETLLEPVSADDRDRIRAERHRLEALLPPIVDSHSVDAKLPASVRDEDLVNALAQYLQFEPVEKQALLERDGLVARCEALIELIEIKVMSTKRRWGPAGIH